MTDLSTTVIGLGSMGLGAALSLARAGIPVTGLDLDPQPGRDLAAAGGRVATTPALSLIHI